MLSPRSTDLPPLEDMRLSEPRAPEKGRLARRRQNTRAALLRAAYDVMGEVGVDAAKIKDITDQADVGFGTFYNYFGSKDELAGQVLDCMIDDLGRRNSAATQALRGKDPALVIPVSMRLTMREAARTPIWQWWALRPDLLVDRMSAGFGPFAKRDINDAIEREIVRIKSDEVDSIWVLANWMMVGGIHDIVVGERPLDSDKLVIRAIMSAMGVDFDRANQIATTRLPKCPPEDIDWSFALEE